MVQWIMNKIILLCLIPTTLIHGFLVVNPSLPETGRIRRIDPTKQAVTRATLSASVTPSTGRKNNYNPNDGENRIKQQMSSSKKPRNFQHNSRGNGSKNSKHQFRSYLRNLPRNFRYNYRRCSFVMDEELQRMEDRWYNNKEKPETEGLEKSAQSNTNMSRNINKQQGRPNTKYYNGPTIEPDLSCYAMVANSYAKAGLGIKGGDLAETVLRRCQSHQTAQKPNAILWTAIMNAWARADQWDLADQWLQHMQTTYETTRQQQDAPDTITFTSYLEALASSKVKNGKDIAEEASKMLQNMHSMATPNGKNQYASPNAYTYAAAIKCQARAPNSMDKVEGLLRTLQQIYVDSNNDDDLLKPGSLVYMPVLNAWSRCGGGLAAARRARDLADELRQTFIDTGYDPSYAPPDGVYTAIFTAYARVSESEALEASKEVDEVIEQMENDPHTRNIGVHAYTAAINAKCADGHPNGSAQAEALLRRMPRVDSIAYQCVIKSYAREGNAEKAEALLSELEKLAEEKKGISNPDIVSYAACIHAWIKKATLHNKQQILSASSDYEEARCAERADILLEKIMDFYRDKKVHPRQRIVDSWIFNNVIQLWSTSRHPNAGDKAERVLSLMEELQQTFSDQNQNKIDASFVPTNYTYTFALDAWATSGRHDAGERALALLSKMESLHAATKDVVDANNEFSSPNIRAISSALNSITKSNDKGMGKIADQLMRRILQLYQKGDRSSLPNARTYTSVLGAIVRSNEREGSFQALTLLHDIQNVIDQDDNPEIALNAIAYNCVLHGLAKQGAVEEAQTLFAEMKKRYQQGFTSEKPDVITYSTMIEVFINSNRTDAGSQAVHLLDEVEHEYANGGRQDKSLRPDTHFYNSVLRAWANSNEDVDAAEKAHRVLQRMEMSMAGDEGVKPDLISYTTVCHAYATSDRKDAGERAEAILHQVEKVADSGILSFPDSYLYSAVMLAYVRSRTVGSREKAEQLFNHMQQLYKAGREEAKPNTRILNLLISGWATSGNRNKVEKASETLEQMKAMHKAGNEDVRPDTYSYNWVILAAARSTTRNLQEKRRHFDIALQSFRVLHNSNSEGDNGGKDSCDIRKHLLPNPFTYVYFIQACRHLLPKGEDQDKLISKAFELARRNGMVNKKVFMGVHKAVPSETKTALLEEGIDLDEANLSKGRFPDIPESWTCQVNR